MDGSSAECRDKFLEAANRALREATQELDAAYGTSLDKYWAVMMEILVPIAQEFYGSTGPGLKGQWTSERTADLALERG